MAQAKGVLPRREDRSILFSSPRACGYFVSVTLNDGIDRAGLEAWLQSVDGLVNSLVAREDGEKIAAVAVGFTKKFFLRDGQPRFGIEPPAQFRDVVETTGEGGTVVQQPIALPATPIQPGQEDAMFYIVSTYEARVHEFLWQLRRSGPVVAMSMFRGYQRRDGTEPFGYKDGLRNVAPSERSEIVFVNREERHPEEPRWADGGSYMAYMRIVQNPDAFAQLPDDATRDQVIGRQKDGHRLDLVANGQTVEPHDESSDPPIPPSPSHVAKAGPRGPRDNVQIFRRGLPFMEVRDGAVQVGLNFCSFQSSLAQLDVVFNDWMMNPRFPQEGIGVDALFDPAKGLTTFEQVGFYFVPPIVDGNPVSGVLAATPAGHGRPTSGRVVVHKRIEDPTDGAKRFERSGFVFQIVQAANDQPVGAPFTTDSTGRAVSEELPFGDYKLTEVQTPPGAPPTTAQSPITFTLDHQNEELFFKNTVTQPNSPYGG